MGATGTGKSSLLNYLCGQEVARAGAGKPVTEEGIFEFDALLNGQTVRIYDSWGIEAGKVERWKSIINEELVTHGADKPIEEWFHSVVYCIQAGGARVQDTDSEIIRQFFREGYNVLIVLTKADQVSEEDEAEMKGVILQEVKSSIKEGQNCAIVSCCAVEKKTRSGSTEMFGRDEIIDVIINNWRDTVIDRLPWHVIYKLEHEIDEWGRKTKNKIYNKYTIYGTEKANQAVYDELKNEYNNFRAHLEKTVPLFISDAIAMCKKSVLALCKTFEDAGIPPMFGNGDVLSVSGENNAPMGIKVASIIGGFIVGAAFPVVGVIGGIVGLFSKFREYKEKHNEENIKNQKLLMVDLIDETTTALKEHVRSQEKQIRNQIAKYI